MWLPASAGQPVSHDRAVSPRVDGPGVMHRHRIVTTGPSRPVSGAAFFARTWDIDGDDPTIDTVIAAP